MFAWLLSGTMALGQVTPLRAYAGVNREIPVRVSQPEGEQGTLELRLLEPRTWATIERIEVSPGEADLAQLFPILWTAREPRMFYAQLSVDGRPVGAPVMIRPLTSPARARSELDVRLNEALGSVDPMLALKVIADLARTQREAVASEVRVTAPAPNVTGLRLSVAKRVRFETTEGVIELELRPDLAPNTCEHFERLVEGGFYEGVIFHRVVGTPPGAPASAKGFIIQSGDPTGTGEGHAGVCIDFEASGLRHDAGVVSMARRDDDPNSASSQFLICLDRDTCAPLDGKSTAFAEVVSGMDVVNAIASTGVGPRNADDPLSPRDRPLVPPVIEHAVLVDAPPAGIRAPAPPPPPPVER